MRIRFTLSIAAAFALLASARVSAQDRDRFGLTMAYPGAIGVVVPVADWLSLRPDFSISHSAGNSPVLSLTDPANDSGSKSWLTTIGISAFVPFPATSARPMTSKVHAHILEDRSGVGVIVYF